MNPKLTEFIKEKLSGTRDVEQDGSQYVIRRYDNNDMSLRIEVVQGTSFLIPPQLWNNKIKQDKGWIRNDSQLHYVSWIFPQTSDYFIVFYGLLHKQFKNEWRKWCFLKDEKGNTFTRQEINSSEYLLTPSTFLIEKLNLTTWNVGKFDFPLDFS